MQKAVVTTKLGYSPAEAARAIGVSRNKVLEMLHKQQIKGVRVGTRWVIGHQALERFLAGE